MLGAKPFTSTVVLTGTIASTVLAGPASGINRYIKQIKAVNGGPATQYTIGLKAAAAAPVAGDPGLIALTKNIEANKDFDHTWGGDGLEWKAASSLNLNGGAVAATQVTLHIIGYEVAA